MDSQNQQSQNIPIAPSGLLTPTQVSNGNTQTVSPPSKKTNGKVKWAIISLSLILVVGISMAGYLHLQNTADNQAEQLATKIVPQQPTNRSIPTPVTGLLQYNDMAQAFLDQQYGQREYILTAISTTFCLKEEDVEIFPDAHSGSAQIAQQLLTQKFDKGNITQEELFKLYQLEDQIVNSPEVKPLFCNNYIFNYYSNSLENNKVYNVFVSKQNGQVTELLAYGNPGFSGNKTDQIDLENLISFENAWQIARNNGADDFINVYKAKGVEKWELEISLWRYPLEKDQTTTADSPVLVYNIEFAPKPDSLILSEAESMEMSKSNTPPFLSILIDPHSGTVLRKNV